MVFSVYELQISSHLAFDKNGIKIVTRRKVGTSRCLRLAIKRELTQTNAPETVFPGFPYPITGTNQQPILFSGLPPLHPTPPCRWGDGVVAEVHTHDKTKKKIHAHAERDREHARLNELLAEPSSGCHGYNRPGFP
ncbi:hypothetical protein CEXT_629471 [Caerostris extrusa]|uniref:Uncharacterized protein n=1 Tax=Caerostris extrusa TaxID=172846 RepID=A0AAV4V7P4_CAEEX|nr:hypothetical protein CEXT_629471 [Caerostris extrusa]